jgi:replicative DNA helicase
MKPPTGLTSAAVPDRLPHGMPTHDPEDGAGTHVEQWDRPVPFGGPPVPEFPLHLLPEPLRDHAEAIAEAAQVPADMPAALQLAAVAACVQRSVDVEVKPGYVEQLSAFVVVASEPATRKTSVMADITAPIAEWEREEGKRVGPEVERARLARAIMEKRKVALQDAAARAKTVGEAAEKQREAEKLLAELGAQPLPPVFPRVLADDVTPEQLARLMAEQGERIGVFSAEGGIFATMAGRYSSGVANLDVFLKGHAGESMRVDRRNSDPIIMDHPALTMGLAVQPDVLRELVDKPGFRGRGLLARYLYVLPENLVGRRRIDTAPVPAEVRRRYRDCINGLLRIRRQVDSPLRVVLSSEAFGHWKDFSRRLEPRMAQNGELGHIGDWAGKAAGAAVRLAGLFHVVDQVAGGEAIGGEVSGVNMANAAELVESYFIPHALAAFAQMGADPEVSAAEALVHWLSDRAMDEVSVRDAHQALRGQTRFRRVDAIEQAFQLAEQHGYVRRIVEARRPGPGRPAAARYTVCPLGLQNGRGAIE